MVYTCPLLNMKKKIKNEKQSGANLQYLSFKSSWRRRVGKLVGIIKAGGKPINHQKTVFLDLQNYCKKLLHEFDENLHIGQVELIGAKQSRATQRCSRLTRSELKRSGA